MKAPQTFLARNWALIGLLVLWQAWVTIAELNSIVMPSPRMVTVDLAMNPLYYAQNALRTLLSAAMGLAFGFAIGGIMATIAWASRFAAGVLTPFALIFSSVPVVALIPIIARLLGYDVSTVIAVVAISAFFPTFVFVSKGFAQVPAAATDLLDVLGTNIWRRFRYLVLPGAVPDIMIALRLIVPEAVLAAILGEFLIGQSGLGYVFRESVGWFVMERALGASFVAAVVAVICFFLAQRAENIVNRRWS